MDKCFFDTTRILDGGMGQELIRRGLKPKGTLWSAHALMHEEYHPLVIETHLDYIKAGAEVIVTSTFTARKGRLRQNNCEECFEQINRTAVELAKKARDRSKKDVLIAGSLPNQKQTYSADLGDDLDEIRDRFTSQAACLHEGIDFFYLDVMNSGLECEIALQSVEQYNLPVLLGVHITDDGKLPSQESVSDIVKNRLNDQCIGVIAACVSPQAFELVQDELNACNLPYGFKLNAFKEIPKEYVVSTAKTWGESGNPSEILGINEALKDETVFFNYVKAFIQNGATIVGGCCEIGPEHIRAISQLR